MVELVAEAGYRAVTVRALAKRARVSTGTFYSQFSGTDECLLDTYASLMEQLCVEIDRTRDPGCERGEQARRAFRALFDAFALDPAATRLILVEVFNGGPAALGPAAAHEARLASALRGCLDRREHRVDENEMAWITAGALHIARTAVAMPERTEDPAELADGMARWCEQLIGYCAPLPDLVDQAPPESPPRGPSAVTTEAPGDETELLLAALTKLAATEGYWRMSPSRASKAAGVPISHFKHYFADLEDGYLTGVGRVARSFFAGFTESRRPQRLWRRAVSEGIAELMHSMTADPATARLALSGILEPGLGGVTSRQALIGEIASAWRDALPAGERPPQLTAEAAVAPLWAALARACDRGSKDLPAETRARFVRLFIASAESAAASGDRPPAPPA
jgi:AcrR family transcriptional regulator